MEKTGVAERDTTLPRSRRPRAERVRAGMFAGQLGLLVLVAGCAAAEPSAAPSTEPEADTTTIVTAADGTRLLVLAHPETAGDGAQVNGELTVTDGGCVGLLQTDDTYTVIWPHGTEFTVDGIEIDGVGAFRFGDQVDDGGGGYYDPDSAGEKSLRDALESCDSGGQYARIHFF